MSLFPLKATHKPVKAYYDALATFHKHGHTTEGNTRSAFADLLKKCASPYGWHLVEEYPFRGTGKQPLRADGALVDELTLVHGLWEAKDSADDLQKEIKSKVAKGYPLTNILFQSPDRAILYQDSRIALDTTLDDPEKLVEVLQLFFDHQQADIPDWKDAVDKFSAMMTSRFRRNVPNTVFSCRSRLRQRKLVGSVSLRRSRHFRLRLSAQKGQ
jgi:hypothetical protein